MKEFISFVWQLPQNILGAIVWLFCSRKKPVKLDNTNYFTTTMPFGVSLGYFIIIGIQSLSIKDIKHEHGHQIQSKRLGFFYLPAIGLPSILGNIWDRLFHRKWSVADRIKWYYDLPWEKEADTLGNVDRFN